MKLEKTREALADYGLADGAERNALDALHEVEDAESLLREAAALKVFAVAGLSAFHGRLCASGAIYPENAAECEDPKCRAWAAAVKGADGLDVVLDAALEEAAKAVECAPASFNRNDHAERIRALKRGG